MVQIHHTLEIPTLPISIWPSETYPLEPVQGWIQRAAERNYALSADAFVDSLGLSGRDWDYDELLKVVQQLPIEGYAELEASTPKRCDEGYEICGHKLPLRFIAKSNRRMCPMCLEEGRYVRTWFDFVPVASCPHHDVALIDGLPGDALDWRHPHIGLTRSGTKVGAEHAIPQVASLLDHFLVGTLAEGLIGLPDHLNGLSLSTILISSICVGKLYRGDENHVTTHENLRTLCQLGFEPLVEGSEAISIFLRKADWLQQGYPRARYVARCGGVPQMLDAISDQGLRHLIADTFARVRVRNGLTTPAGRLSRYDGEDGHLNLKGAARQMGLSSKALRGLLQRLGIQPLRSEHGRARRLNKEQLASVKAYIDEAYGPSETANRLGCTCADLKSLAARRILQPAFRKGGRDHYTAPSLEALENSIAAVSADHSFRELQPVKAYAERFQIPLAEACSRVLRGDGLFFVGHASEGPLFDRLRVAEREDLDMQQHCGVGLRTRVRPQAQVRDAITFAEAAARLGTGSKGLRALIDHSYIRLESNPNGIDRIDEKSLESFTEQYARASLYAPLLKCAPTVALRLLREKGVIPINEWEKSGPRFVSKVEVFKLTGLSLDNASAASHLKELGQRIDAELSLRFIPANVSIIGAPAIVIRASTGRWRLEVQESNDRRFFRLASHFRSTREHARYAKVNALGLDPQDIWPAARVQFDRQGGFVLIDDVDFDTSDQDAEQDLINRIVERAYQLHQIL